MNPCCHTTAETTANSKPKTNPKDQDLKCGFLQKLLVMLSTLILIKMYQNVCNLSLSANVRKLLEKGNEFIFDTPQLGAFNKLKQLVANTQTLKFFDKNLPIKITCDGSKLGLERCLNNYMKQFGTLLHLPPGR